MKKGNINIIFDDCMNIMESYEDNYFNLAIVDPPYGIGESGITNHTRSKAAKAKNYKPFSGYDKKAPPPEYFDLLKRKSKNQIVFGANHFIDNFPFMCNSSCWLVWDKQNTGDFADCELAWTSFKTAVRKIKFTWNGMIQGDMKNKENRIHPTQKPVALYDWIYKNYASKDMKILDTHLGSGSNAIAAHYFGVKEFVGIELDEDYFCAACKRFEEQTMQLKLF